MARQQILCVGDSLTRGRVGWSYIPFSRYRRAMINEGRDGDTTWGLERRLPTVLRGPDLTTCIVGIGTNDLLLPFLSTQPGWRKIMGFRSRLMHCRTLDDDFERAYRALVSRIHAAGLTTVIVGLPLVELRDYPDDVLTRRNRMLRDIANQTNSPFVDTVAAMAVTGPLLPAAQRCAWSPFLPIRAIDAIVMQIAPPTKDRLAAIRKLQLTVDGVHWTSRAAKAIAQAIDDALDDIAIPGLSQKQCQ